MGAFWQVDHYDIKPYPTCRWPHAAIDAARELGLAHGIAPGDVAGVEIASFDRAGGLSPGMPDATSQAQYSRPFAVALMIAHSTIALSHIAGEGLRDPAVARLVAATTLTQSRTSRTAVLPGAGPTCRW